MPSNELRSTLRRLRGFYAPGRFWSFIGLALLGWPWPGNLLDTRRFPVPPEIRPTVRFWIDVFTRYHSRQALIIDEADPSHILRIVIVDGPLPEDAVGRRRLQQLLDAQVAIVRQALNDLAQHGVRAATWSPQHAWLWSLYGPSAKRTPDRWNSVGERLRIQWGHRDRFREALRRMGTYGTHVQAVLRAEGLPEALGCLPLIESGYQPYAVSPAGATGLWQLMRKTARKYGLVVHRYVDQRLDPILSTRAAARYLKAAYDEFGNWPLAITAYNYGIDGMRRAVRSLRTTDYVWIWKTYSGPRFGYAVRNFYPEFIAACMIAANPRRFFPDLVPAPAWHFHTVRLQRARRLRDLPAVMGISLSTFIRYNPQFLLRAFLSNVWIRRGTELRLPVGEPDRVSVHIARPGETLASIARVYRVPIWRLREWNPHVPSDALRPGIPVFVHPNAKAGNGNTPE